MKTQFKSPISSTFIAPLQGMNRTGGAPAVPAAPPALLTSLNDVWEMNEVAVPPSSEKNSWNLVARIGAGTMQTGVIGNSWYSQDTGYSIERINTLFWDPVNSFSLSFWFKNNGTVLDTNYRGLVGYSNITSNIQCGVNTQGGNLRFTREGIGGGVANSTISVDFANNTSNSTFYHYVLTYDGTDLNAYVNNSLVGTKSPTGSGLGYAGHVTAFNVNYWQGWTGMDFSNTKSAFGYYDQVAWWTRAITETEIAALYNSGAGLAYSSWTT